MASFLRMPGVSADSDEATLEEWSVSEGNEIHEGDVVATVETEKAVVEIASDRRAVVHKILIEAGATVPVGDPIAVLLAIGELAATGDALLAELGIAASPRAVLGVALEVDASKGRGLTDVDLPPESIAPATVATAETPVGAVGVVNGKVLGAVSLAGDGPPVALLERPGRIFVSPIARRIARDAGLSLDQIEGSGPGGRMVRKDVERAIARMGAEVTLALRDESVAAVQGIAGPAAAGAFIEVPHTKFRKVVAARLQASKQHAPHFYLRATMRVDKLLALREQVNATSAVRVSINDFFVMAAARALADVPRMNVVWTDEAIRQFTSVDVSVAIASERGLVTPVVRGAEKLSLTGMVTTIRDYAERADQGRLQQYELDGGTLTVTNLGMFGVEEFAAIINPPQVGILAIGAVVKQPVVGAADRLEVGTVVTVTLSVDHRPVDGVLAAQWLKRLRELIENPIQILV
ncbi:MAG: 2-oxo acid dehydrogenase subunit E2 [Dermatophilaceae bacterium]